MAVRNKLETGNLQVPFPGFIDPALATALQQVPTGESWIHEIKFEGERVQVHVPDAAARLFDARGEECTDRFRTIAAAAWQIKADSAIIDGIVVSTAADGPINMVLDQLKVRSTYPVLVAFDLLYLNGFDLRQQPLTERKGKLRRLIVGTEIQFSHHSETCDNELFAHARKFGLHGVVSKLRDGRYASGRSADWATVAEAARQPASQDQAAKPSRMSADC